MTALLTVRDLEHRYADGTHALRGLDLHLDRGEHLGLVGRSGAGKSTLLLHLNRILAPSAGQILLEGSALALLPVEDVRRRVGVVFQDPDDMLFTTRVEDDVAFGPVHLGLGAAEVEDRVTRALAAVGQDQLRHRIPYKLSGGQKRAVSIATVLAMDPEILVLDEPSAGLDAGARRRLIRLLRELPTTLLIASHDLELVLELCPRVTLLNDGRKVATGPATKLLADGPLMESQGLERPPSLGGPMQPDRSVTPHTR